LKYWLYFTAKLLASVGVGVVLQLLLNYSYPPPPKPLERFGPPLPPFLNDMPFTFLTIGIWLVVAVLVYLSVLDQKRRCRTCLRKLIMPVPHGSWGNMVIFGRPQTEWICAFGHGTLSIEELQITGYQTPDWQ